MSKKTPLQGGLGDSGAEDKPAGYWQLVTKLAVANLAEKKHRRQRLAHLEALRALVKDPRGVDCPEIEAAGRALAEAPEVAILEPFNAFSAAVAARARETTDLGEGQALSHLSTRVMEEMTALSEAIDAQLAASNEAALIRAQALRLMEEQKKGPGVLH
ncbi:hypothetical protein [Halomonas sp. M4R1S46]|uniref:hypothetical protein n=1 Tax=Halomonas sp. M4R1S46 TaxID=2982692 RepID=UPI0021E51723|nr:hypothetical protein [Halomonas sp. M4R1S46]UYG08386.1 hypothetical protein OCT48_03325 [Halomonas sp. M4R1S46]